ncbi:MAG: hypothetical protein ABI811_19945 [Acidobacteriota bacterium]
MEFLTWVEQLSFSTWIRESGSLWGYSLILTLHTIGLSMLVGISFALDLRLLGFGKDLPIGPFERYYPLLWIGFWINALSGVILLMADATTKMINPVFYVKMGLIGFAVWNVVIIRKRMFHASGGLPPNARALALISLTLWVTATTAGRLMAYLGPVAGLQQ